MSKSRIDAVGLIAAMIAAGVGLMLTTGALGWAGNLDALVLLVILFGYDREGQRSMMESLAFAAVTGFCFAVAALNVPRWLALGGAIATYWIPLTWVCATAVIWIIDRSRMSSRDGLRTEYRREPRPASRGIFDGAVPEVSARQAETARDGTPELVEYSSADLQREGPQAPEQTRRPLKEVGVYVNLVGEGLNLMRSVKAEHVGRNYYRITESMPEGETWEYRPGQIVRCEKRKLSTGKGLVAVEEARRQE